MVCRECGANVPQGATECAECGARASAPRAKTSASARRKAPSKAAPAPRAAHPLWLTHALALGVGIAIGIAIGYGIPRGTPTAPTAGRDPSQMTDGEMRLPPGHPDISTMVKGDGAAPRLPMGEQ